MKKQWSLGKGGRIFLLGAMICAAWAWPARASLEAYDTAITTDAVGGLTPIAKLVSQVTLTGANRAAFDFGNSSGDVTMEFILEGNPAVGGASAYLAVGTNTSSNLRYEANNNTSQLGFTQLSVADYVFRPAVSSPTQPTHVVFVWQAALYTMVIYINGVRTSVRAGVNANFTMPRGQGYLGANPSNTENMTGVIYRVTVYDDVVSDEVIQRHSDAFNDIVRPPIIVSFSATPLAVYTPGSATLAWDVRQATAVFLNGSEVTTLSNLTVTPTATTTYTLIASNNGGSVTGQLTVLVNPAPVIKEFTANRTYIATGEMITLSWKVDFGQVFTITPSLGNVTSLTTNGIGRVSVQPAASITYTLTAENAFGTNSAVLDIHLISPAKHPVISEFLADDEAILADEDGEFSGWIEIFNPTSSAINLAGYYLTDDPANPTQWPFPPINLEAGAYLVVFASSKDRTNVAAPLHANFQLNNDGEYLALIGPGPVLLQAFAPAFPPQRENISYGILAGDPALERFMANPTPGTTNQEALPPPLPVQFSQASGLFTQALTVTLNAPDPAAQIYFTTNGTAPSTTNGALYFTQITITNTTRLRAVAVVDSRASRITGASFIKIAAELAGYTSPLPIMVIENFGAGTIPQKGWSGNGAGIKQVPRQAATWATFERVGGTSSLTNTPQMISLVGIRGRGAFSTEWRQKPYSVEGMDEHGEEAKVAPLGMPEHADWVLFFPDPDTNKEPALLFNTFAYELSKNMGRYAARFRWVEAFINEDGGELTLADRRGVYAIIEKIARGKDRLDFQRLSPDGATGSWLLNINRMDPEPETGWPAANGAVQPWFFHTAGPDRVLQTPPNSLVVGDDLPKQPNGFLNFDNPSGYVINTNQRAAIENWLKQFEDVLYNNNVWRNPTNGYRQYLEVDDFVDYFILNVLTRNGDGLLISIFPWKGDDNKLRIGPAWDYNWSAYYVSGSPTGALMHRSDRLWYARLFTDPDFFQRYVDRWWEFRRGPLSNAAMEAIINRQAADITLEKSVLNGMPNGAQWDYRLGLMKTWLKNRADWIDSNYVRPPAFNQNGGMVASGFRVTISGANGAIYFTADGADPRASGGGIATSAQLYQQAITVSSQTVVQARIKNGTNWSGLTTAVFYTPQDLKPLVVTEIMYNPTAFGVWNGEDLEFLELKNIGSNTLELGTLTFTAGINLTFTNGTRLGPGQFFVLARNAAAFQSKYPGGTISGIYTGKLDNAGETIRLQSPLGDTVFDVTYNDRAPWPVTADGYGFSAVPRQAAAPDNSNDGTHWRASARLGGSPGADDAAPATSPVVINEILTHTDPPMVDMIELYNPTSLEVDVGGWFLSDDGTVPKKFCIPAGTRIPAGGYQYFTEADFNPTPGTLLNFALDSSGDSLYLCAADAQGNLTGYTHSLSYGAAATGVSFGRLVNSAGEEQFPPQISNTLGTNNAGPVVGPVVISEIMYHPGVGGIEYLELQNITNDEVPLFDPQHPTNAWRINGLAFTFPPDIVLPANGRVLIVATNPAFFSALYSVPTNVLVLGPFAGVLQNNGERLELQRPDSPATNGVPYITVDEVRYDNQLPWPTGADGFGASLQRMQADAYGNDPANWTAAIPAPGLVYAGGQIPAITAQPASQTALETSNVTFSVAVSGAGPFTYLWFYNGAYFATTSIGDLVLTNIQLHQQGNYSVLVLGGAGSVVSSQAMLTVLPLPKLVVPPRGTNVFVGNSASFSVTATGTGPLTYQWRFNGADIPGATGTNLYFANVQLTNEGAYQVLVTDSIGQFLSAPANLVPLVSLRVIQSPVGQTNLAGTDATFSVSIEGYPPPFTYQLRKVSTPLVTNISSASNCTFTLKNVQPADSGNYRIAIFSLAAPGGVGTAYAQLLVVSPPVITAQPKYQWLAPGGAATFNVTATGTAPLAYQWYFNVTNVLSEATNTSLVLPNVQITNVGLYHVVVTNPWGAATSIVTFLTFGTTDLDGDGMPDAWELTHGLQPQDAKDRDADVDGDGRSNWEEYICGTDPRNPLSVLRVTLANDVGGAVISFTAMPNVSYAIQYRTNLTVGAWAKLSDVAPLPGTNAVQVTDPSAGLDATRYYRIVTP